MSASGAIPRSTRQVALVPCGSGTRRNGFTQGFVMVGLVPTIHVLHQLRLARPRQNRVMVGPVPTIHVFARW